MSFTSGTATSYNDLLNKLRTFLTTDTTLVSLGQNWTELAYSSTGYTTGADSVVAESYLKAPGLSGTESIYINIRAYNNASSGYYNWEMRGATGYLSSNTFTTQSGTSPGTFIYLWNGSIPYWFVANGERVIIVAEVSTVYSSAYLGKILPYGTPGQYPYPVFVGGNGAIMDLKYSDTSGNVAAFFDPVNAYLCMPGGSWQQFQNWTTGRGSAGTTATIAPWFNSASGVNRLNWQTSNLDGSYALIAGQLQCNSPTELLGEFDGVYFVTGYSISSGSTVTVSSTNYLVFQDSFRTATDNYMAIVQA